MFTCIYIYIYLDLYNDRYVLGKRADCDIVISGLNAVPALKQIISKVHFAISRDATHVPYIEDLSKNGTYLNGQLIGTKQCATLCDGDMICVGVKQYTGMYIHRYPYICYTNNYHHIL